MTTPIKTTTTTTSSTHPSTATAREGISGRQATTVTGSGKASKPLRATAPARCKFCGKMFDMSTEGNTYGDGTAAHEWCADEAEFEKQNRGDFED